jgi:hypothetical protein
VIGCFIQLFLKVLWAENKTNPVTMRVARENLGNIPLFRDFECERENKQKTTREHEKERKTGKNRSFENLDFIYIF